MDSELRHPIWPGALQAAATFRRFRCLRWRTANAAVPAPLSVAMLVSHQCVRCERDERRLVVDDYDDFAVAKRQLATSARTELLVTTET
jgi:hypothetical protein